MGKGLVDTNANVGIRFPTLATLKIQLDLIGAIKIKVIVLPVKTPIASHL